MSGSILMVTRNGLALTKKAIASAMAQDYYCDVMVIDNASTDGTIQWLRTKKIAVGFTQHQHSLAACWNRGLRVFWATGAREVLVINNDVELRPDTYRLLKQHEKPFITAVSVNDPAQMGTPGDRNNWDLSPTERPHPDFSAFLISKAVTDKVGYFDEDYYPAYCEDCSYHMRMHRAGINAVCVDLPFYHAAAQTLKGASEGEQARIRRGADANRERFRRQYGCLPGTPEYSELFKVPSNG